MELYYYIDQNGYQRGPMSVNELYKRRHIITRDTKVWRQGMSEWHAAGNLSELSKLFSYADVSSELSKFQLEQQYYYIDQNGNKRGPMSVNELYKRRYIITQKTMFCRQGTRHWQPAETFPELSLLFSSASLKSRSNTASPSPKSSNNGDNNYIWYFIVIAVIGVIFGVGPFRNAKYSKSKHDINTIYTQPKQSDYSQPTQTTQPNGSNNNGGSSNGYNNGSGHVPLISVQPPKKEWHNCSYCNGTGKHQLCNGRGQHMCKTCNGLGQRYNTYTGLYERCVNPNCRGGYTNCSCSGGLCPSCNGTRGSYY